VSLGKLKCGGWGHTASSSAIALLLVGRRAEMTQSAGRGKGAGISFQILRTYEGGDTSYNNISLCVRWSWVIDFAEPTLALE
jgi:hypothetical protein